jgi:hypothetical protein
MNIYSEKNKTGELWTRNLDGKIQVSNESLSTIFNKYKQINIKFYNELINNKIKRFDLFYDSLFIETETGYIFEKIVYQNNQISLYQNNNNFNLKGYYPIDYWFDELKFKVYIVEIKATLQQEDIFDFYLILTEYDCKTGLLKTVYKHNIILNFYNSKNWGVNSANISKNEIPIVETPKICYNKDTNIYNISFIIRNNNINKMGIISINLINTGIFKTESINGMVPFCDYCTLIKDQNIL